MEDTVLILDVFLDILESHSCLAVFQKTKVLWFVYMLKCSGFFFFFFFKYSLKGPGTYGGL